MVFVRRKMNQVPVQHEGWHLVLDGLFSLWRRSFDCRPDLLKDLLNIGWKARDVLIDAVGRTLICFQFYPRMDGAEADGFTWWAVLGSNQWPPVCKTDALPLS